MGYLESYEQKHACMSKVSKMWNTIEYNWSKAMYVEGVKDESNYIAFEFLLRYFTSPTSPTWVTLLTLLCIFHISDNSDMSNIAHFTLHVSNIFNMSNIAQ